MNTTKRRSKHALGSRNGRPMALHLQWFFHFLIPNATSQFRHLCTAASGTHVSAKPWRKRVQSSFSACS